jgi:hypothetical protein
MHILEKQIAQGMLVNQKSTNKTGVLKAGTNNAGGLRKQLGQNRQVGQDRCACFNSNRTAHIRHQCRKTPVLSCHIFLIDSGVERMNHI